MTPIELQDSLLKTHEFIDKSPRSLVHVISDAGDVVQPVRPTESLQIIREVGTHDRLGWNLILNEKSAIMKIGIALGTSVFKTRTRTFDTLDEIKAFMLEQDTTIHWDQANTSIITTE